MLTEIQAFIGSAASPAVVEFGDEILPLTPGTWAVELRGDRVWIDVWGENRTLSRRILSVEQRGKGSLDCTIHRFGGASGKLTFLDLARPQSASKTLAASRHSFGEQFRRMLFRHFPGWQISGFSSGMDLQRSFSPLFPRAWLTRGHEQIAAMACAGARNEWALLTFALLWLDHVERQGGRDRGTPRLCVFLPEPAGAITANRLRWLNESMPQPRIFRFNEHGSAGEVDARDLGNIDTRVASLFAPVCLPSEVAALLSRLAKLEGVGVCPEITGTLSIRSRGTEFARVENGRVLLGIEEKQEVKPPAFSEVERFATEMQELREPPGGAAERWLESVIRPKLTLIDPLLREDPVHRQVLSFAGGDRDLIDLLGVSSDGRLAIIELKAAEDIHLPMQGLDYWTRIRFHAGRGELDHLFPGVSLAPALPRLFLVAPAISFHSANEIVLRYLSRELYVERVGINSDWARELKVVLRLKGADAPQSHGSLYEHTGP